jgi:hypothetical protein
MLLLSLLLHWRPARARLQACPLLQAWRAAPPLPPLPLQLPLQLLRCALLGGGQTPGCGAGGAQQRAWSAGQRQWQWRAGRAPQRGAVEGTSPSGQ